MQSSNIEFKERKILVLLDIEFVQQLDFVIGEPKPLSEMTFCIEEILEPQLTISTVHTAANSPSDCHNEENDQIFNINNFTIFQCKDCKNIITHSEYWSEGMVFTYLLNINEGDLGVDTYCSIRKIFCTCGNDIGIKYIAAKQNFRDKYLIYDRSISMQNFPKFGQNKNEDVKILTQSKELNKNIDIMIGRQEPTIMAFRDITNKFEQRLIFVEEAVKKIERGLARLIKKVTN